MSVRCSLVSLWNAVYKAAVSVNQSCLVFLDSIVGKFSFKPKVLSLEETLELILKDGCSISRFGDGEIKLTTGHSLAFQHYSNELGEALRLVLSSSTPGLLVCIPDIFGNLSIYNKDTEVHWKQHLSRYRKWWLHYLGKQRREYGNAFITRCYNMYLDKSNVGSLFEMMKKIWEGRDIILVEGKQSRLGVGNDLFHNATSIKRMLAPNTEAFSYRQKIIEKVREYEASKYLILLALGPTATVLAYDLSNEGYQALDIGHIDIEYEWFRMGASKKVPVKGKYVNEAGGKPKGRLKDEEYEREIVWRF